MRVIETSLDEDLALFSRYLWQQNLHHRIFEESGRQVLEVARPADAEAVRFAYDAYRSGHLQLQAPRPAEPRRQWAPGRALARHPGLVVLVGLAVVAFPFTSPLTDGELTWLASWLTIVDLGAHTSELPPLGDVLGAFEVWRWIGPVFIHFNLVHLLFNCVVVIVLGLRVERRYGPVGLWAVVLVIAAVSNLGQYALSANPLFGGLSGVAYGLLGTVLVSGRLQPDQPAWHLPRGFAVSLLLFLVLFSTGVTELFGLYVANSAHWLGLVTGALAALPAAVARRD